MSPEKAELQDGQPKYRVAGYADPMERITEGSRLLGQATSALLE